MFEEKLPEDEANSEESTTFTLNKRDKFFMTLFEDLDPAVPEVQDVTMNISDNEKMNRFCLSCFELSVYHPPAPAMQ